MIRRAARDLVCAKNDAALIESTREMDLAVVVSLTKTLAWIVDKSGAVIATFLGRLWAADRGYAAVQGVTLAQHWLEERKHGPDLDENDLF